MLQQERAAVEIAVNPELLREALAPTRAKRLEVDRIPNKMRSAMGGFRRSGLCGSALGLKRVGDVV